MLQSRYFIALFFFLALVVPTTLQEIRGGFLVLIILFALTRSVVNIEFWKISKSIFYWLFLCVSMSAFAVLNGFANNTPGAMSPISVYILWPIIFVFFIGCSNNIETYNLLIKTLIAGIFTAAASQLIFIVTRFINVSFFNAFYELQGGIVGFYDGSIEFNLFNMTTSIYGLPFLVALILMNNFSKTNSLSSVWYKFAFGTLLLTLFSLVASGRRGFILVGFVSVPLSIVLMRLSKVKVTLDPGKILGISFLILVSLLTFAYYIGIDYFAIYDDFISGFNFQDSSNISAYRRHDQFLALIDGWTTNPFIGSGFGAVAADNKNVPIADIPWAYELQYIALLFQTGLLGTIVYGSAIIWVFIKMIKFSRKYADLANLIIPVMVGLSCFLIVNSTNPYLSKFDFIWTIFLPIGLINIGLLRDNDSRLQR